VKAYTGGGDRGTTSLLSGERVAKSHSRIEACGDVDELNCTLGALIASLPTKDRGLRGELENVQADLFRRFEAELPPLQGFILPGGHPTAAWAHLARTVCRRAERRVVQCAHESDRTGPGEPLADAIAYLNRLSSLMFTVARVSNQIFGVAERTWQA